MEKCEHYHEDVVLYAKTPCRYRTLYRCYATKDCEECTCCGDKSRCNFYPEVRKEAKKMNTAEMWLKAQEDGKTYVVTDGDCAYQRDRGLFNLIFEKGGPWKLESWDIWHPENSFQVLMEETWEEHIEQPEDVMTKSEAEAKFNIKIVG